MQNYMIRLDDSAQTPTASVTADLGDDNWQIADALERVAQHTIPEGYTGRVSVYRGTTTEEVDQICTWTFASGEAQQVTVSRGELVIPEGAPIVERP